MGTGTARGDRADLRGPGAGLFTVGQLKATPFWQTEAAGPVPHSNARPAELPTKEPQGARTCAVRARMLTTV